MEIPSLESLPYQSYLDAEGKIPDELTGKIGVYAIFDRARTLQLANYSRNVYLSLKQHLTRKPHQCYEFKLQTIEKPSRTILEEIKQAWIAENGSIPPGNSDRAVEWNEAIDTKPAMTEVEKATYEKSEELARIKLLKTVARRVEAEILETLKERGAQMEFRFNPKIKERGLLDL
ncbi:GIY-YIG nuclease family protein [Oscillatoria sp. FACHB-1406]|uniref:GIY-YIG nuclease family protein n=1 Tax=Oscillatoria sp. FACHB-1406 TaxID=2692846 RepID=UPI001682533C|nr:GIY-YIG nuclease family protein [Oscillatoria sp. FACHB-1406]MBD2578674.1 GIY-YIG nuclease family protein [Oscillatoria sp. FACHB-1406]